MGTHLAFDRLIHSDWSIHSKKRWTAVAHRSENGWLINNLRRTPAADEFLTSLFDQTRKTLAGFDFPIGLPAFYLNKMKLDFRELLSTPNSDMSRSFFSVVETLHDISPAQPFYRSHPSGGRHSDLLKGLECEAFINLLRECDKKTKLRSRAESVFWTVGAKQVGKAALAGWREILVPALQREAGLLPFDGPLAALDGNVLTIAETYPGEVYQHIGMSRIVKKRSQSGRRTSCAVMLDWASERKVEFSRKIKDMVLQGFGEAEDGEDPFDAIVGLCGMIEVSDGRRAEAPDLISCLQRREGWILGQIDLASA